MTNKQDKQRRRKSKLLIALLMILLTGVVFTASTYAWFTSNKTVTVEHIDVNVVATDGLQISVDATTWKPNITNDDITGANAKYAGAKNQLPATQIRPVSTGGNVDANGMMEMFVGSVETEGGNFVLSTEKETESHRTEGNFIAFDLFFNTGAAADIYLTNASKVTVDADGIQGIQNAARVAFIKEGSGTEADALATLQGLKADGATPIIWEPNFDTHTASGVKNANDTYGITTTQTGGSQLPYRGVISAFEKTAGVALNDANETRFKSVTPTFATPASGISGDAYQNAFRLDAGITKYRIYMWIEGQDVDCENNASGATVSFNLQFSLNSNSAGE